MPEISDAYILTEHVHDIFFEVSGVLDSHQIRKSGCVRVVIGSTSSPRVRRIEIEGEINGRRAKQTLAKDRLRTFHLSTTFLEEGGEHTQSDIRPESPPESEIVLCPHYYASATRYRTGLLKVAPALQSSK